VWRGLAHAVGALWARLAILAVACACLTHFGVTPATAQYPSPGPSNTSSSLFLQSLGHISQDISQIELTGIQQQVWSIEDRLQAGSVSASRPTAFAADPPSDDPVIDSAFAALGYSGEPRDPSAPVLTKAPQPPAEPSHFSYSAWTQGLVDYENRTGTFAGVDIGRNTLIGGGLAAADVTVQGVTSGFDAFVFGLLTGDVAASIRNADGSTAQVHGPSIGAYSAYVNGPFSVDGTFKTDFFDLSETTAGTFTAFGLNNYVATGNVNYKRDFGSWWFQPTAGTSYTRTVWDAASIAFGMTDGTDVRVQGGARFGSEFDWAGIHFSETLALLAYDDVTISGGTLAVATGVPLAPTDEGKIFGQAIGRLEAQLTANWSVNAEGEIRGRDSVYGIAGRLGVTYTFN
jgi:hypothetical protein